MALTVRTRRAGRTLVAGLVALVALTGSTLVAVAQPPVPDPVPATTSTSIEPASTSSTTTTAPVPPTSAAAVPTTTSGPPSTPTTAAPDGTSEVVPARRAEVGEAELGISKTASVPVLQPSEAFEYTVVGSCSSLTADCAGFTVTDTLPAEFEVTSLPPSNSLRDVTFDPATRLLTVVYKLPVSGGATGLPAGSAQAFKVGMRLPADTAVVDGQVVTNTATATADGEAPVADSADVTAVVPVAPAAAATKSWSPAAGLALSDAASTVTLSARNSSSTSTRVAQVSVEDSTVATWERFDLTDVGTLEAFPPGADQVLVDLCLLPVTSAPCDESEWTTVGPLSGAVPLALSAGGNPLGDVVGLRYRFSSSSGADLPYSADGGRVAFDLQLRSTLRSSGAELNPTTSQRIDNCATPSVTEQSSAVTVDADACARYTIQPGSVVVRAAKTLFSDSDGNFAADGVLVPGQPNGVSMGITGTNDSAFAVPRMSITEPSPSALNEFAKMDVTTARVTFPAGATQATLVVVCRSGADPADVVLTAPPTTVTRTDLGCAPGVAPASVQVVFRGVGGGAGTIAAGAQGKLELHGTAPGVDTTDVANGLTNCAEVRASSNPDGTGSSTSDACATAQVQNPRPAVGSGVKSSTGVSTIVPGQRLDFNLSFKNTGNIPVTNVVLADPPDPTASPNPFSTVRLSALSAVTTSPPSTLEVYDPDVSAYVPYVASNAALLSRARGIRVTVTGNMAPGATFRVKYAVQVREGVPVGATFRNCAAVGIDAPLGPTFCNGNAVQVANGSAGASINKILSPDRVVRPQPGLAPQVVQVKHQAQSTGTLYLKQLVLTDKDADFFDATTYLGSIAVNFPPGANRVRVDVCTSVASCAADTWVNGTATSSTSPGLPGGVVASTVKGIRFTFSNSNGGYEILPSPNFPTSGTCANATVCFNVQVRETLASAPSTPVPDQLADTSSGAGESALQSPGSTFGIPPVTATLDVVRGAPQLSLDKTPDSRIGPGDSAPVGLVATNTGTDAVVDPVVVDPLPASLTFDPVTPGAPAGQPYLLSYTLPAGYAPPPTVTFTEVKGGDAGAPPGCTDPNRVCTVSWSFPGWTLPPGGRIQVQFQVRLSPGVLAGETITNLGGTSGANPDLTCRASSVLDDDRFGAGRYCTDTSTVTTLAGDDFQVTKWVRADESLGFLDATGAVVPVTTSSCPKYFARGGVYTRFPCTARTLPGQSVDYLVRGVNSGTNPAKQVVLVDGLPVQGDTGVLLSNQARGTQWTSRPTMLTPVVELENRPGVVTGYSDAAFPGALCTTSLRPPPATCPAGAYAAAFGPSNTGFQTVMSFPDDQLLNPGEEFTLVWTMRAPPESVSATLAEPVAWNSIAYRPTFRLPSGQLSSLPASEPLKVGVSMPQGAFGVTKSVVGLPNGIPLAPFEFAYQCTVQLADGTAATVDSGTFSISYDGSWGSRPVPQGADCAVWETNTQGADNPHTGLASALRVTIDPVAGLQTVNFTNSFETGLMTLTKRVEWDAVSPIPVGPFTFDVSCAFPTPDTLLPGFPRTVVLADGETWTLSDVPKGTACLVVETDTGRSTTTSWSIDGAAPQEDVAAGVVLEPADEGGTEVLATNTYQTGGVRIVKQLDGPASLWAQGLFTFDVRCTKDGLPDVNRSVTLSAADLVATVSPVPEGYLCGVTESAQGDAQAHTLTPGAPQLIPSYTTEPPGPVVFTAVNDYPGGSLTLRKELDGGAATLLSGATFTLRAQCERDLVGGAGTQVFVDRSVTLRGGQTTTLPDVLPIGARCWVEETESRGASAVRVSNDATNKATVTDGAPDLTITTTNTFSPGGNRSNIEGQSGIKVVKSLAGPGAAAAVGPFTFETVCTVGGYTLPTYPVLTLTPTNLVGYVNPVPAGAECTVTETGQGSATGVVPRTVATVTVPATDAPAVEAAVVNRFDAVPPTTVPQGGGSNRDDILARTGGSVARPLGASAALLVLGAGLLLWRRRRDD